MITNRRWLPIALLLAASLALSVFPADRTLVAAVQRGDAAATERRYSETLEAYDLAAAHCPGCPQPHLRRGATYVAQGRYDEAQAAYLAAVRTGGLDDRVRGGLARLYVAQGSQEQAIGLLQELLARRPGRGDLWMLLGEAHLALDQPAVAGEALERSLDLEITDTQSQVAHDRLGLLCLARDDLAQGASCALEHFTAAEHGPDATLAERAGRLSSALSDLDRSDQESDPALARARLGEALYHHGELDLARRQFEAALELEPAYVDGHAYLGHILSLLGEANAAVEHLQRAIDLEPGYTLPAYFLGLHYLQQGWPVTARDVLVGAHDLDPDDPAICAAVADTYLRGDAPWYDVAEQWLHAAVDRAPNDPRFHLLLAHFYVDRAIDPSGLGVAAAQVAVDLAQGTGGPDSSEAHETLGWAYHLGGRPGLAVEPLQRALELASERSEAQFTRAQFARARIHYRLGEVYRALDQGELARHHLQMAIDLDWNGPIGERARQSLSRVGPLELP
jgi:tetratricopeptide (TPR) repeat protein